MLRNKFIRVTKLALPALQRASTDFKFEIKNTIEAGPYIYLETDRHIPFSAKKDLIRKSQITAFHTEESWQKDIQKHSKETAPFTPDTFEA